MNDVKSIVVKLKHKYLQKQIAKEYFRDFKSISNFNGDFHLIYQTERYIMDRPLGRSNRIYNEIYNFKNSKYVRSFLSKNY